MRTRAGGIGRPTVPGSWSPGWFAVAKPHSVDPKPCTTTTPMSSQASWRAGGRNAAAQMKSVRPPPSWAWTLRKSQRRTA